MKIKYQNEKTGELIKEFNLLPGQEIFLKSKSKYLLYSGGFGCGKTLALCLKVLQHCTLPNNYGLLGRLTYNELQDSVQKTFFEICPASFIRNFNKAQSRITFTNNSELIFRHLDTIAESEIRSLNLGFFAIDQAEEISENVFLALQGRLRREDSLRQGFMTCNPAMTWLYKYYKQEQGRDYELIEGSTLDNRKNLPQDYIESLLKYPESWKRQFVYGIWDESLLSEKAYFPIEYINEQREFSKKSIRDFEGFRIYQEKQFDDEYQIGADPADFGQDYSVIIVTSKRHGDVVATWKGKIPADELSNKINQIGRIYRFPLVILEKNGIGLATLNSLKKIYSNIYQEEIFDNVTKKKRQKLGWTTTFANKPLLFDNYLRLLRENRIRINDERILDEMKTFVWSDEAKTKGLGAETGFHDDMVMAAALAFWGIKSRVKSSELILPEPPRNSFKGLLTQVQNQETLDDYIGN
jgi:hypothetical protein